MALTVDPLNTRQNMVKVLKLVGGIPTPLKNMSSSVGIVFPIDGKMKNSVPNHQAENYLRLWDKTPCLRMFKVHIQFKIKDYDHEDHDFFH